MIIAAVAIPPSTRFFAMYLGVPFATIVNTLVAVSAMTVWSRRSPGASKGVLTTAGFALLVAVLTAATTVGVIYLLSARIAVVR